MSQISSSFYYFPMEPYSEAVYDDKAIMFVRSTVQSSGSTSDTTLFDSTSDETSFVFYDPPTLDDAPFPVYSKTSSSLMDLHEDMSGTFNSDDESFDCEDN